MHRNVCSVNSFIVALSERRSFECDRVRCLMTWSSRSWSRANSLTVTLFPPALILCDQVLTLCPRFTTCHCSVDVYLCTVTTSAQTQSEEDTGWNNGAWDEAFRGPQARTCNLGFWPFSLQLPPLEITERPSYSFSSWSLFISVGGLSIMLSTAFFWGSHKKHMHGTNSPPPEMKFIYYLLIPALIIKIWNTVCDAKPAVLH